MWSWIQISIVLLFISYLFANIAAIGNPGMFIYGGFVFLSVYAYTELMDRNVYALAWEILKNISGIGIIFYYGDWFGAERYIAWINYPLVAYFTLSSFISAWFIFYEFQEENEDCCHLSF